jgi:glucose/arabinose dehydrogenase
MNSVKKYFFFSLIALTLVYCNTPAEQEEVPVTGLRPVNAFPNLTFNRPVDFQQPTGDANLVFVLEQEGVISVFENNADVAAKKTFLDVKGKVDDGGNEEGLLGLAFHPSFATNGFFYVNYTATNPDRTVIARYHVLSADAADPASEVVLLEFDQPFSNHNGGQLAFGPDGFLYIAVGDGGSGGDPQNHGQDRTTLLGSILRIDVDHESGGKKYAIPADNPFVGNTSNYKEEIFAYGLRNPWRMSFDSEDGRLWVGDVGQGAKEEIDIVVKGGNYGWNLMEGKQCFQSGCNPAGLKLPIWDYGRSEGFSITGGYVYHGAAIPSLEGKYIYADFGSQKVWSLDFSNADSPVNTELFGAGFNIASFGVDKNQELYLCGFNGSIYKLTE